MVTVGVVAERETARRDWRGNFRRELYRGDAVNEMYVL